MVLSSLATFRMRKTQTKVYLLRITMKYIAYFRVSTSKQHRSGLGLAAQKAAIERFLQPSDQLTSEFIEATSGRVDDRQKLHEALRACRKHGATLLIAKLDRFSRRVSFIAKMMESDVSLAVADMPNASAFQLHIFAALAQEERRLISIRTRDALAQAKLRGVRLGVNGHQLAEANRCRAKAAAERVVKDFPPGWQAMTYSQIARLLNSNGLSTMGGSRFYPQTIKNILTYIKTSH